MNPQPPLKRKYFGIPVTGTLPLAAYEKHRCNKSGMVQTVPTVPHTASLFKEVMYFSLMAWAKIKNTVSNFKIGLWTKRWNRRKVDNGGLNKSDKKMTCRVSTMTVFVITYMRMIVCATSIKLLWNIPLLFCNRLHLSLQY